MSGNAATTRRSRRRYLDDTTDPVFRSLSARYEYWREYYTSMLLRDLESVFPYPLRDENFEVEVLGDDLPPDTANGIADALTTERRHGRHRQLNEALRHFGAECAPHLVAFGVAAYELAFVTSAEQSPERFRLHLIHPYRRRWGRRQHYLVEADGSRGKWITLPRESVIEFQLPDTRRPRVAQAVEALAAANVYSATRARLVFARGVPYNFSRHVSIERELLARATAPIGWRGRGLFTDEQLEPFRLVRDLRFEAFQAELRDVILRGLNEALARAALRIGITARLVVRGLPDAHDVAREIKRVRDGPGADVSLQDVLKPFY